MMKVSTCKKVFVVTILPFGNYSVDSQTLTIVSEKPAT